MIPSNKKKMIITNPTNFLYRFYQVKTFIFSLCLLYQSSVLIKNMTTINGGRESPVFDVNFQNQPKSPAFSKLYPSSIKTQIFVSFCILSFLFLSHVRFLSFDLLLETAIFCLLVFVVRLYLPSI